MILGFKNVYDGDSYHFTTTQKFVRVIAGMALPLQDRVMGAIVVLAEKYSAAGIPTLIGMGAKVGAWPDVELAAAQYRRDLKFNYAIVENEVYVSYLFHMKGLKYAQGEIPLIPYAAPPYATSEMGRSYVDELFAEGRLILDESIQREVDMEPEMGALCLKMVCCWVRENKAVYRPLKNQQPKMGRILGVDGL